MNEFIREILIPLVLALIISIVTAYVTVRLSLRQFYSQRWWDKKAEAYYQILEHLSYLKYYYGEWLNKLQFDLNISEKHRNKLSDGYSQAKESIAKASAIGELIVSESAIKSMEELLSEIFNQYLNQDPNEATEKSYNAVVECIKMIREEAKKALSK
jgi:hypothetical protein